MDTLGQIILSIIERLSSFGAKYVLSRYKLVGTAETVQVFFFRVSFIRGSTVYSTYSSTCEYYGTTFTQV